MATTSLCPSCGKPLAPDAPQGLCQECLFKAGFPTGADTGGHSPRFVPPAVAELAGKFPQLEILGFIGQGGMGAVYQARQKQLNRVVALKILPLDIGSDRAFAERFTREAQALAQLNHPGIVTLYEFGQADGLFYFLMEFVDGVNLRQLLQTGRVSAREALAIVPQICDALQFAHDQGLVHRDIKPENILLDRRGRVKVADFGLAKLVRIGTEPAPGVEVASGSPFLTESGKIMGTPSYMAPEQVAHPAEVDHRADIYALGVVFYQMLTGELPGRKIEPPSKKVQVDVRLDEIVLRALEKEPARRYQHVSEVGTDLETISRTEPNAKSDLIMKKPVLLSLLGAGALCVMLAVILLMPHGKSPQTLTIRAFIDGNDVFFVSGNKLWIEHYYAVLPGKPIYVNHRPWTPTWSNNISSELASLHPAFKPRDAETIQITKTYGRGIVSVEQYPSADNDRTLAVRISDDDFGGADWYELVISWGMGAKPTIAATKATQEPGAASDPESAISAATEWLEQLDAGDYSESWKESSTIVQSAATEQQFTNSLSTWRQPLGHLLSRKLILSNRTTRMPGAPEGQYTFMQFETSFANRQSAIENITFMLENGEWKSAAYFIR